MGARIFSKLLGIASGKKSKSEGLDTGDAEFTPWQWGTCM